MSATVPPEPAPAHRLPSILGLAFLAFWAAFSRRFTGVDPDLFWHLKFGQLIQAQHRLFEHDVFSWSAPGGYWLNQEWGGQVLIAWLYGLGGLPALETFHWLLFCLTAVLATRLFMRAGWAFPVAAFAAVVLHFLLYGQSVFRLQNLTTAGVLLTVYVLQGWSLHRRLGKLGLAYPLIVAVWANLHGGGAIAAVISCGIVLVTEAAVCLKTRQWRSLLPLLYLALGAGLGLLATPAGIHLPLHSIATLTDPSVKAVNAMVLEWAPFTWNNVSYRLFVALLAITAVALAATRRVSWGMLALAAAWTAMAFVSRRNLALAPIALAPIAAGAFAAAWQGLQARSASLRGGAALALALGGCALIGFSPPFRVADLSGVPPYPSAQALRATMTLGKTHRMMNFYEWGGLFIFLGYPDVKVFIDGRGYHYGPTMMRDYNDMMNLRPGYRATFERYGADMVVAPPFVGLVLTLAQDPGWRVAFEDATAIVVVRRDGAPTR